MLYQINDIYLDSESGVISQEPTLTEPTTIQLENIPLKLLLCLIKYQGQDVTKDTMLNEVWTNKVVTEDVLTVAMSQIRKALGDKAKTPKYIKTISGTGYRLIATVKEINNSPVITHHVEGSKKLPRRSIYAITLAIIVTVIFLYQFSKHTNENSATQALTPELNNEYQKARYLLTQTDRANWLEAKQVFEDTIIKAPEFPPVYRDLVEVKLNLLDQDQLAKFNNREEYYFLLKRSIELQPNNHASYLLLAHIAYLIEWNFPLAKSYFIKALSLAPNEPSIHFQYAKFLMAAGEFELSLKHTQQYISLDPEWYAVPMVAWIYNMMEEYDLALIELKKLQKLEPSAFVYHISAQSILENLGDEQASFNELLSIFQQKNYTENELTTVKDLFKQGGLAAVNLWLLEVKKEQENIGQGVPPLSLARYAVKAGKIEQAVDYILQAYDKRQVNLLTFNVDPVYKTVRNHPKLKGMFNYQSHLND